MSEKIGNIRKVWASRFQETKGEYEAWKLNNYRRAVFLKLGTAGPQVSAKGCQEFRETKIRNGERLLLAVLNLYVRIKSRVWATFDTNHSVTDSTQTINRLFSPEAFWFCSQVSQRRSPLKQLVCQAKRQGYRSVWG